MVFNSPVLYPSGDDAKFDLKYYLDIHLPMVEKHWKPHGLKDWKVVEFQPGPDGNKPYDIAAMLTWESQDGQQAAMQSEGTKALLEDVTKFSNKEPLFLVGNVAGSS